MSSEGFYSLDPERILKSAEVLGFEPTGQLIQLNSYENRVFSLKLESDHDHGGKPDEIVGKFYRPGRWARESIQDEHDFTWELFDEGVNCIPPLRRDGKTLFENDGIYYSFFPKRLGRLPQELLLTDLKTVGRTLARIHNIGSRCMAEHRMSLDSGYYGGWDTLDGLQDWIAPEVLGRYNAAAENIIEKLEGKIEQVSFLRIHGDCHRGNILDDGSQFLFIDFDDFVNGPAVQDFWMLLSWDDATLEKEKGALMEGYSELRHFDDFEWSLVDCLRGLRIIGYAGWIAARWSDPTFRRLFSHFEEYRYWAEEVEALEKIAWRNF